jgi:hypothetical protein
MWAITVRAPVSRLDAEGAVQQFARSLVERPPRRAANVVGIELNAVETSVPADT